MFKEKFIVFFCKNEIPSFDKALKVVNNDNEFFSKNISRTILYRILKDFGLSFERWKIQALVFCKILFYGAEII